MRILSSEVNMDVQTSSQYEHKNTVESTTTFRNMLGQPQSNEQQNTQQTQGSQGVNFEVKQNEFELSIRDLLNKYIVEMLLGRFLGLDEKVKMQPNEDCCCHCNEIEVSAQNSEKSQNVAPPPPRPRVSFSTTTDITNEYFKKNTIDFEAKAKIQTEDKDIDVDLNISYTTEFYEKYKENVNFDSLAMQDPLIIQYDLSSEYFDTISDEMSFEFDINSDGEKSSIPMLREGSGFLALDKNSNGNIDDGSELFGPNTNNGFAELKQYDEDGNDWIDENDSVFNDLRIWAKDDSGEDKLIALADANVGAIYLSDVASSFDYDKSANENMAHLKSSSIFLTEDGKAGLVTGVDFAVS